MLILKICSLIIIVAIVWLALFIIFRGLAKEERLDKYNGPEDTIYLNVKNFEDMRCPYQLMTVKHDGFMNGEDYIHIRLKNNKIMIDTPDRFGFGRIAPSDNLNNNTSYSFLYSASDDGYVLKKTDDLYKKIIKDNNLKDETYQEVYMYLKQKNDSLRLTSDEINALKKQFNKAQIEYDKYIENTKPKYDFSNQKHKMQVVDDLKELLSEINK